MQVVVVCIETGEPTVDERIEILAARLRALVLERQLGDYDGCDRFSSEARLYLFSNEADRLAAAVMELVGSMSMSEKARIRVSLDPLGAAWRDVSG